MNVQLTAMGFVALVPMMERLANLIANRAVAWGIVVSVAGAAAVSVCLASGLEQDEDILAFLPQDNPDVRLFYDINRQFGGTEVALVGVETADPFDRDFLAGLRRATNRLRDLHGLDHVLSLANVIDFTPDEDVGGVVTERLIDELPGTVAAKAALRAKVMSRDAIVGNLIAADARGVVIYCYLGDGVNPRGVAERIRSIVTSELPGKSTYWAGGPFVSTYIYNTAQNDLTRLTPWAVLAIVVIMMLVFRDPIGTSVALLSTAIGILISLGIMKATGVAFNIMLSSTPVVLFAIGSAYGLHILARYYTLAAAGNPERALHAVITGTGPVVIAAGLTTAVSLLSFVAMDIEPIRTFGIFTSLGIVITLLLSVTFIPAVIRLTRLERRPRPSGLVANLTANLTRFAQRRRVVVLVVLAVIAAGSALLVGRVDTSVDMTTFFRRGSPPDLAAHFMREHFGGSQFVQVHVTGDMTDPHVLRQLRYVADEIALLPHVTSVLHIGDVVALSNNAMVGQQRIPDTPAQLELLLSFVETDPAVGQLLTGDRQQALLHIKVGSERSADLDETIDAIAEIAAGAAGHFTVVQRGGADGPQSVARLAQLIVARIRALARLYAVALDSAAAMTIETGLATRPREVDAEAVAGATLRFLRSAECAVDVAVLADPDPAPAIATAVVDLGANADDDALTHAIAASLGRPVTDPDVEDLAVSLAAPLADIWLAQQARQHGKRLFAQAGLQIPRGGRGERFVAAATTALLDLNNPTVMLARAGPVGAASLSIGFQVNGLPVMHRGLSRSITRNQLLSLCFAVALVLLILSWMFRSVWSGLLGTAPTLLTISIIYGGMGALGVHLDFGTSMLACIIMGAGVDYAVHFLSAWRAPPDGDLEDAAVAAAQASGTAIWTNAVMIAAGFLVLTTGEAKPLQNVGGLTAAAMLVAAAVTFLVVPALARRRCYRRVPEADRAAAAGDVAAEGAGLGK